MSAYLSRRTLSRRAVLRGGGATIALPLLSAMVPAGTASAATPRARFAGVKTMRYLEPSARTSFAEFQAIIFVGSTSLVVTSSRTATGCARS